MNMKRTLGSSRQRQLMIFVLLNICLIVLLTSCKSKSPALKSIDVIRLSPPESALISCEIPEFTGISWGDSGIYTLALKRELQICKRRLDEVIYWLMGSNS
ncbi:Rz1-like lysis system protein LysC [Yersinia pseudotuberculosis]|uniref:Rz1-like lysis system protein LysC n=2 Tax=Yersinia pseudotuberculosis TaxID=633 RepID=UPI003F741252